MASGTTTRQKHNATVTKMGKEIADDPARVKKCSNRVQGGVCIIQIAYKIV